MSDDPRSESNTTDSDYLSSSERWGSLIWLSAPVIELVAVITATPRTWLLAAGIAVGVAISAAFVVGTLSIRRRKRRRTVMAWVIGPGIVLMAMILAIATAAQGGRAAPRHLSWGEQLALISVPVLAFLVLGLTLDRSALSNVLDLFSRRVFNRSLTSSFGLVDSELSEADISRAFPRAYPPENLRDFQLSGYTEDLARAAAWAEGLRREVSRTKARRGSRKARVTTIGLVNTRARGPRLAVINYFLPRHLLRAWLIGPSTIVVANEIFPVVTRPWLPSRHGSCTANDGHCWVSLSQNKDRFGIVTSKHAISSEHLVVGSEVKLRSLRSDVSGILRAVSSVMDAALIEIGEQPSDLAPVPHSKVIGFKPVRICTGHGTSAAGDNRGRGMITGLPGFENGVYLRQPDGEPTMPAIMTFNVHASPGDSGCMVVDIEGESLGHIAPYLIYQGVINLGRGKEGYGVFLGQISEQWTVNMQLKKPSIDPLLNKDVERSV